MDYEYKMLSDLDLFFFYGEPGSDILMETESDILAGVLQPKRSLFYNRRDSAGVTGRENMPNSLVLSIMTKYDITTWNAFRNQNVSDGENGTPDRRVAISQETVSIRQDGQEMDVLIEFIPFNNMKTKGKVTSPLG